MLKKPYKCDTPENTINKIRNLLHKIDCMPYEILWGQPTNSVHFVRVQTDLEGGNFGTNGKATTKSYALASAYGEFMERIQNALVMRGNYSRKVLNSVKKDSGCYYYPDEKFINKSYFENLPTEVRNDFVDDDMGSIDEYFSRLKENGYEGCLSVPFLDANSGKEIFIPQVLLHLITGSNGMAAGNTLSEATFQGLCELCERYSASEVYYKELTPPTIPRDYIKENMPEEYKIILEIEKSSDFSLVVKDFSANLLLPCIGLILLNKDKTKYRLNIGSELDIRIALSRTLTEIYQGVQDNETMLEKHMHDVPKKRCDYFINDDLKSTVEKKLNFNKFVENGKGVFPLSLFEDGRSYDTDLSVVFQSKSYDEDVKLIIERLTMLGHRVFIRNVSFLGFPSVFIYIPYVSRMGKKITGIDNHLHRIKSWKTRDCFEDFFGNFIKSNFESEVFLKDILNYFEINDIESKWKKDDEWIISRLFKIEVSDEIHVAKLTLFFLFVGWLKFKDYKKSLKYLELFTKESNLKTQYYAIVKNILHNLIKGESLEEVNKIELMKKYKLEDVDEVFNDLQNEKNYFKNLVLPLCPNCANCKLIRICISKPKIEFVKRINRGMMNSSLSHLTIHHETLS